MMRLIDADALAKFIDYGHLNNPNENLYSEKDIREMIYMMPVFNVVLDFQAETPKHGHWIEVQRIHEKDHTAICECSLCGDTVWVYDGQRAWNYCPRCGAKMDGERREDG